MENIISNSNLIKTLFLSILFAILLSLHSINANILLFISILFAFGICMALFIEDQLPKKILWIILSFMVMSILHGSIYYIKSGQFDNKLFLKMIFSILSIYFLFYLFGAVVGLVINYFSVKYRTRDNI